MVGAFPQAPLSSPPLIVFSQKLIFSSPDNVPFHFSHCTACCSVDLMFSDIIWWIHNSKDLFSSRWYFHNNIRIVCRKQLPDKLDWLQQHTTGSCAYPPAHSIPVIFMKHAHSICYISSLTHTDINHSECQKPCMLDYLLYFFQHKCIMPQRKGRGKK